MPASPMRSQLFCLLSSQRSGSTWLADMLQSHPDVRMYGEVFLDRRPPETIKPAIRHLYTSNNYYNFRTTRAVPRPFTAWAYLRGLKQTSEAARVGFKLMNDQLRALPEIWPAIVAYRSPVLYLKRRNALDIVVSHEARFQQGRAHSGRGETNSAPARVHIDTGTLVARLARQQKIVRRMERLLWASPVPSLSIVYEDLKDDREGVLSGVANFLGLSRIPAAKDGGTLRRVNPGSYEDKISNYDEVSALLQSTPYSHYLLDEGEGPVGPLSAR